MHRNPLIFFRISAARRFRAAAGLSLLMLGVPAGANAQIYSWHDEDGRLVLANSPRPGSAELVKSYPVPASESVRTTSRTATERARMYEGLIVEHARRHNVRPDLVRAVIQVESAFNPYALSPKGAQGLMQLMPATARQFGVRNPYDPEENVRAGVAYLRELLDRYDEDEELALAAYNAGPGAVDRYGERVPPYAETRNYVAQIGRMTSRLIERRDGTTIYKVTEVIDGREVVRYTDQRPAEGTVVVVGR